VRGSLAVQKTRLGQLFVNLAHKLKSKPSTGPSWGGMQMFAQNRVAPGDPRRETVYHNFQRNLQDIVRTGIDAGAQVLLSTVAVNLKDCPPFASLTNTNLLPAQRIQFEQLSSEASALEKQRQFAEAAGHYARAAAIDPNSADLQFRWAECLERQSNSAVAGEHFQLACDCDALPFRADSRINASIKRVSQQFPGQHAALVDAAARLDEVDKRPSPASGAAALSLFYEHVHLSFDGNYCLARAWAEQVEKLLPASVSDGAPPAWATQETCERHLGLTDWNRCNVLEEAMRRMRQPPLSGQPNNPQRLEALNAWEQRLRLQMTADAAENARRLYAEALQRSPDDYHLHENFSDFLAAQHDYKTVTAEWELVHHLIPQDHVALFELGRVAALQGKFDEAQAWLAQCLEVRPAFSTAWFELGKVQASQTKYDLALQSYERALRLQPQDYRVWFSAGLALSKSNRRVEAIENYRKAVQLNPDFWEAHFELGGQLGLQGNIDEARAELEHALRLKPDFAMGRVNLGVALLKQGYRDQALRQFEEALRLEPTNAVARSFLLQVQTAKP
jgi:tetratricopeptide (TPR) repeat protein